MQTYCPSEFHPSNHLAPVVNSTSSAGNSPSNAMSSNSGCLSKFAPEIDPSYASGYNNWPNGYNNYQYASCPTAAAQSQYPTNAAASAPTMLIYPQVYSTVNQNQIHLHLHGTDKIEQYLNSSESGLTISSARNASGIDIGIGTGDNSNVIMEADDAEHHHHQQQQRQHEQQTEMTQQPGGSRDDDPEVVDPGSVWRPY